MFQKRQVRLQQSASVRTLVAANPVLKVALYDKDPTCLTLGQMKTTNKHLPSESRVMNGEYDPKSTRYT